MADRIPLVYSLDSNSSERLQSGDTLSVSANSASPTVVINQAGAGPAQVISVASVPVWTFDNSGNLYGTSGTTTMSTGFVGVPGATGIPTGTPTLPVGNTPLYFNRAANSLHAYNGTWVTIGGGGGGGLGPETIAVITTNTSAALFTTYIIRSMLTLTLPATPTAGDWVRVVNRSGLTDSIIARNGSNIQGVADDLQLDSPNSRMTLAYVDGTDGWVIISE